MMCAAATPIPQSTSESEEIQRLQAENQDLWRAIERLQIDFADHGRRIKALEAPLQNAPIQRDRADTLIRLLATMDFGKMLAKDARHRLGLSKSQFSHLLKSCKDLIEIKPLSTDKRIHVISLRQPSTNLME